MLPGPRLNVQLEMAIRVLNLVNSCFAILSIRICMHRQIKTCTVQFHPQNLRGKVCVPIKECNSGGYSSGFVHSLGSVESDGRRQSYHFARAPCQLNKIQPLHSHSGQR